MDLFGIKKRKEQQIQQKQKEEEKRLEEQIQIKIKIRKTLNSMKLQSKKMDSFKKDYIEKARKAKLMQNKQTYNLAKQGLRLCMSKQRFLDSMVANFEIALQMNEMNKVINEFIGGMNIIAEDLKGVTSSFDIVKAQAAYEKALANNETQYEALDAFLKEAECSIESFAGSEEDISDTELESLILNEETNENDNAVDDLDEKIMNIQNEISER